MPLKLLAPRKTGFRRWLSLVLITVAGILLVGRVREGWGLLETIRLFGERPVLCIGILAWTAITAMFAINQRYRWLLVGVLYFGGLFITVWAGDAWFNAPAVAGWIYHGLAAVAALYVGLAIKRRGASV